MSQAIPIPPRALVRLRASYEAFETLAAVVVEAMDVDQEQVQSFDLKRGVVVLFEEGAVSNGVAQEAH